MTADLRCACGRSGCFECMASATAARLDEARVESVPTASAAEAMRRESGRNVKLTAKQRRRVREMLENGEAYSRAEAVAWVQWEDGQ